jgi:lipopolysaccharide export system protein LptC
MVSLHGGLTASMTVAPLPLPRPTQPPRPPRLVGGGGRRRRARLGLRHFAVGFAKRLLPVVALVLLSLVALWPEINHDQTRRLAVGLRGVEAQSGQLTEPRYHGVDDHDRPYALTATTARQVSPDRIDLTNPKGDITLENGNWLMIQSRQGVFMTRDNQLDLSGDVVLYRDDGLTMTTSAATVDLKVGAASSAELVHAEGPFGSLDAQGFSVTDRGTVMHFAGPGRLVLNGAAK